MAYVRHTSIEAYREVMTSGLLGERQKQAYEVLFQRGPLTGNELSKLMELPGQWKRCSELKKRGLATEVGERECRVTGRNCIVWDVTANPPHKAEVERSESSRQKIKRLETEIETLKRHLEWPMSVIAAQLAAGKAVSETGVQWFHAASALLQSKT